MEEQSSHGQSVEGVDGQRVQTSKDKTSRLVEFTRRNGEGQEFARAKEQKKRQPSDCGLLPRGGFGLGLLAGGGWTRFALPLSRRLSLDDIAPLGLLHYERDIADDLQPLGIVIREVVKVRHESSSFSVDPTGLLLHFQVPRVCTTPPRKAYED